MRGTDLAGKGVIGVYPIQQPHGDFLPQLTHVLSQYLGLVPVPWGLECLIEGKGWIARNGKVCVKSGVHNRLRESG